MSKPDSWMPMYWADFFVDTAGFDAETTGMYLSLLGHAWMRGGKLPDDDRELARLARASFKKWVAKRETLLRDPYFVVRDGFITQKRLTAEYTKALQVYISSVENGKLGGRPPKTQTKPAGFVSNNRPVTRPGNPDETQPQPQLQHTKDKDQKQRGEAAPPPGVSAENWTAWVKRKGRRQTEEADRLQRKHLAEWAREGQDPNRIVENALAGGWQGLHPDRRVNPHGRSPTFAERRTATIDRIVNGTHGEKTHDTVRDISSASERVDSKATESLPVDIRESGRAGIRRRG